MMDAGEGMELMAVMRLLKQHAEISLDPTLLMLVAKAELLAQQQEADLMRLEKKVYKLKQKLQPSATPKTRRSKKGPQTSETIDCYVAPSYRSVQSLAAAASGNAANGASLLDKQMCDLSMFDAPGKPFEFPSKDLKEADEVSSTTHTESSSSGTDDRATESKRSESSARGSPTEVLPW